MVRPKVLASCETQLRRALQEPRPQLRRPCRGNGRGRAGHEQEQGDPHSRVRPLGGSTTAGPVSTAGHTDRYAAGPPSSSSNTRVFSAGLGTQTKRLPVTPYRVPCTLPFYYTILYYTILYYTILPVAGHQTSHLVLSGLTARGHEGEEELISVFFWG